MATPEGAPAVAPAHQRGLAVLGWGVAALVVAVVRNRLWATPNLGFFAAIAEHPGRNPFPAGFDGDYLLTNVTGPVVAWAMRATAPHRYVLVHLVAFIVGTAAVLVATRRRFGESAAATLAIVVAAAPGTTTTLEWLGQPDAFTAPLAMGLVVARRPAAVSAVAVLIGVTHPEQGIIIAATAAVARVALDLGAAPSAKRVAAQGAVTIGGVLAGAAIVRVWFWAASVTMRSSRWSFLDIGFDGFWRHHRSGGIWLPIALWGVLWIPIAAIAWQLARHRHDDAWADRRRRWVLVAGAAALAAGPVLVTLDQTRVYAMTTTPLLVAACVLGAELVPRRTRVGTAALVVALVVPGCFTAGRLYGAWDLPPSEFAPFLWDGHHPGRDMTTWLMEPFPFEVPSADE